MRLWTLYLGIPLIVVGFVVLGGAFEHKWNLVAVVFGWGMAEVGIMITTVATLNYLNNSFFFPGEISAQARVLGGFAVPYFQIEWASKKGALQSFGCEAAIQAGLFLLIVPLVQIKGDSLRRNPIIDLKTCLTLSGLDTAERPMAPVDEGKTNEQLCNIRDDFPGVRRSQIHPNAYDEIIHPIPRFRDHEKIYVQLGEN
ncbi:hypothetical protein H4Q26_011290 [Puccinia striiformis f. sp. tritici PST-130]|nr:hypothetical protein H4Q26_011290 [Puccinia striiformis f. sp. tritici PST-130]